MVYDLSQIETRDLRLCDVCRAEPHERDKFCRRCGVRLDALGVTQSVKESPRGADINLDPPHFHPKIHTGAFC